MSCRRVAARTKAAGPSTPAPRPEPVEQTAADAPAEAEESLAEVIPLGGSVELAAVLELTSHVIDLVETGETVRVHKLEMQETVAEI